MTKTNAMRLLEQAGISFEVSEYEVDESDLSGVHAAKLLGEEAKRVFKTLVTRGEKKGYYVFCIPSDQELDLKRCASLVNEKKIEMLPVKDLLSVTGYIRGGCSPIGMKKKFPTYIDETASQYATILISAGVRGKQIVIAADVLTEYLTASYACLTKEV